jgi:hypothetical protein
MASNYVRVVSHYPEYPEEDLPSDSETGKLYDGMSRHIPIGRTMEPTRNYNNPKHEQWIKTQPMRYANGLSITDTYKPGNTATYVAAAILDDHTIAYAPTNYDDYMLDEDMINEEIKIHGN